MNKDVIYIDVEDDITAIIGKVKATKEKIVALVPPKRVGVLQSAVNLRLLARAAEQSNKRLVLITNNQALIALSAPAKIPVARNLQSKPELAQVAVLENDDNEDIIDGAQLPVGELARMADTNTPRPTPGLDKAVDELERDNGTTVLAPPPVPGQLPIKPKSKKGPKVPNFSAFRKRLLLIIAGVILLIAFLIWALFFAAHAKVIITAKTMNATVNQKVTIDTNGPNNIATNTIHAVLQQQKKKTSVTFDPTGTKDVGTKATGTMTITRSGVSDSSTTIPAGTGFSSGDFTFVSTADVTVPRSQIVGTRLDNGTATVAVTATANGDEYNLSARSYQPTVSGFGAQGTAMSGGSSRQIKVVSSSDVQKATDQLAAQKDDSIKAQLQSAFGKDVVVINESYTVAQATPVSTPAIDAEATGQATLASEVTYTMTAIPRTDLSSFLDATLNKQLEGLNDQRVYDNGVNQVSFATFASVNNTTTVQLMATGKVGPKIDEQAIKQQAKGKRYGDIQSQIQTIQGVSNVDVKFSPFWVTTAPNDPNKITIEFKLTNGS